MKKIPRRYTLKPHEHNIHITYIYDRLEKRIVDDSCDDTEYLFTKIDDLNRKHEDDMLYLREVMRYVRK
jgi:hypothetical protein